MINSAALIQPSRAHPEKSLFSVVAVSHTGRIEVQVQNRCHMDPKEVTAFFISQREYIVPLRRIIQISVTFVV